MTDAEFNAPVEDRVGAIRGTLSSKAKEYARADRLHNFKQAALVLRCSPQQALLGFLTKHLVSIVDMVQDQAEHPAALWDEKIGDAINYLVLLEALVKEGDEREPKA